MEGQGFGEVTHAPHGHHADLTGVGLGEFDDGFSGALELRAIVGVRKIDVAQAVRAVHEIRMPGAQRGSHGARRAAIDRHVDGKALADVQGIARGVRDARVTRDRGDRLDLHRRRVVQKKQSHGVVDADVRVENHAFHVWS